MTVLSTVSFVRVLFFISLVFGCCAKLSCLQNPDKICVTCTAGPNYDIATNCTTCVEPRLDPSTGCTECMEGDTHCYTGHFTFSVLFHSYMNPQHLCGECMENGPVCCDKDDQTDNCGQDCFLRLLFSVQPFEATALDVVFPSREFEFQSDNIAIFEQGPRALTLNRSNPYRVELVTWTGRLQFYIVVYDFYTVTRQFLAIDRFLIDLELGPVPNAIPRQTYHGMYNIAKFDLSFNTGCSDNYYGPQCCSKDEVYTCDSMGNRVCINPSCDPSTDCPVCTTMPSTSTSTLNLTVFSRGFFSGLVVGGFLVFIPFAIIFSILLCRLQKLKHKTGKCQEVVPTFNPREGPVKMEECVACGQVMTINKSAIETGTCVANGQASTLKDPAVKMEECVAYGLLVSTSEHTFEGVPPTTTEPEEYDYI